MYEFLKVSFWEKYGIESYSDLEQYLDLMKKSLNNTRSDFEYYEEHHIVPKSFEQSLKDLPENRVILSGKDHFIAHQLLSKCFIGGYKTKMVFAYHMMCYNKTSDRYNITPEDYELSRSQMSEQFSKNNPAKREDVKKKIAKGGEKRKGVNNGNYGGLSELNLLHLRESRKRNGFAKGEKNSMYGKHHTEESKRKMSEHSKGKNPKLSETAKTLMYITNGVVDKRISKTTPVSEFPEGFYRGRSKGVNGFREFNDYRKRSARERLAQASE